MNYLSTLVVVSALLAGCAATPPAHTNSWLSYKYNRACNNCSDLTDTDEAIQYYCAIGVDPAGCAQNPPNPHLNIIDWKKPYFGFNQFPPPSATYANLGDLRIGRDMYCTEAGQNVACIVGNYGPPPYDATLGKTSCAWAACDNNGTPFFNFPALNEAIGLAAESACSAAYSPVECDQNVGGHAFAYVAMTFTPGSGGALGANTVKFYVFDKNGDLVLDPALDGEGPKTNPRMCMACHGGTYDASTHSVSGGYFLPFDVWYFQYGKGTFGFYRAVPPGIDAQQENFRQLNLVVKATNPPPAIGEVIDSMYPDGVANPNSKAVDGLVPSGWAGHENLYNSVVRQYCRTCHLASATDFATYQKFKNAAVSIESLVCETHDMPHAQVPYALFWLKDKQAQIDLRDFLRTELPSGTDLHDCR